MPRLTSVPLLWVFGFLLCAFCALYVGAEDGIYVWDFGGYDQQVSLLCLQISRSWERFFTYLYASVYFLDYNALVAVPLVPFRLLFGEGRVIYILSIALLYVIPSAFLMMHIARISTQADDERLSDPMAQKGLLLVMGLLYWPLWMAALRGEPDVAGLLPLGAATLLFWKSRYLTEKPLPYGALMGLLLWGTFLLRRWYAFSIISLLVVAGFFGLYHIVKAGSQWKKPFSSAFRGYIVALVVAVFFLQFFQKGLFLRILSTSYAGVYEAYQRPFLTQLYSLYTYMGPVICGLILLGAWRALRQRNEKVLLCFGAPCLTFILFSFTQAPSIQHFLPTVFWFFIPAFYGASWLLEQSKKWQKEMLAVVSILMLASFLNVFSPAVWQKMGSMRVALPTYAVHPLRVPYWAEHKRLAGDLKTALAGQADAKLAVFAASLDFSDDMLAVAEPSLAASIPKISDIDARDGFHVAALEAGFAVVTVKPMLCEKPEGQQVIVVPNQEIMSGQGVGEGYRRYAGPYQVADDNQAYIYQRVRPVTDADIKHLLDVFHVSYPAWERQSDDTLFVSQKPH